ncbi:MAG: hypothetical protein IKA96_03500 [Alistipes sp.]|nr:hypothetical protein [Alistipes sp.]MBR2399006.1 hypothetical protein [Alistipes sp.]
MLAAPALFEVVFLPRLVFLGYILNHMVEPIKFPEHFWLAVSIFIKKSLYL